MRYLAVLAASLVEELHEDPLDHMDQLRAMVTDHAQTLLG
jgi:hypothetical protein